MNHDLLQYLLIKSDVPVYIAEQQAIAVNDMKPNLTVWSPGGDHKVQTLQSFLPTLNTISKQTGYELPD